VPRKKSPTKALPPIEVLRGLFCYEPETGRLLRGGREAGYIDNLGYRRVSIGGKGYQAARVVWALVTGHPPADEIDHIDGDRSNNRWSNLREATRSQQMWNTRILRSNTSGYRGVSFIRAHKQWRAAISVNGKKVHLGYYQSPETAHEAFQAAAHKLRDAEFMRAA